MKNSITRLYILRPWPLNIPQEAHGTPWGEASTRKGNVQEALIGYAGIKAILDYQQRLEVVEHLQ